jgi:hypothetical protein
MTGFKSLALTASLLMLLLTVRGGLAQTAESPAATEPPVDFASEILPVLRQRCFSCHGSTRQESNYRLDIKTRALGSGDYGDSPIVPGSAAESPLFQYVSGDGDFLMPPEESGPALTAGELDRLRRWIDQGATWPETLAGNPEARMTTDHWSFQPVADVPVPPVPADLPAFYHPQNEIDRFVASEMAKQEIAPSPPADRVNLIRRLYLAMHGLQPTPQQVQAFLADTSPDAWQGQIDKVLSSRHYGERWARHWLDVVRFGESTGYEVNRDRSNAWYYRDYVIEALNQDKSWRDFVIEQLAGDLVGVDEATGFLVGGPYDIVKSPDINLTLMQRQDELADYVNTTSTAFLGLTVGCARCHNHKFDPILQSDFYSLQAVFAGVEHGERQLQRRADPQTLEQLEQKQTELEDHRQQWQQLKAAAAPPAGNSDGLLEMVNARQNTERFEPVTARLVRFTIHASSSAEPCLDELEVFTVADNRNVALASAGSKATSSGDYAGNPKHQLPHIHDGKYGNDHSWISDTPGRGWVQIEFPQPLEISRVEWGRDRQATYADRLPILYSIAVSVDGRDWQEVASSNQRKPFLIDGKEPENAFIARLSPHQRSHAWQLLETMDRLRAEIQRLNQSIPTAYVGRFRQPEATHRLYRGDPQAPREQVPPDTLQVMGTLNLGMDADESIRRLKLAEWIASEENPLTARVIVNRVWHYHFGKGLVTTPSDFGSNGAPPSHPELLDWLASRFMENGWSLKWLHRQILTSATWQQSSRPRPEAIARDADCRWLWRFPPRRLEAEAIRDCVLQLSGKLNLQAGGPGFLLFEIDRENVHHYFPLEEFGPEHFRRMIYMTKIRQEQDDVFGAFDCPDAGQTIPRRTRSTTALQALNLLNSPFMLEQAGFLAERLRREAGEDSAAQASLLWQLAYHRSPPADELKDALGFVQQHGLEALCRAVLNSNEFLFLE